MAAPTEPEPSSWDELLRQMLPDGAPLPDEDQLDYSISIDYVGPSPFFKPPIDAMFPRTKFTTFPKQPPSLTPRNPSWLNSHSCSDTTNSDNRRLSTSSIAFYDAIEGHEHDAVSDRRDPDDSVCCDERALETEKSDRDLDSKGGSRNKGCRRCGKRSNRILLKAREGCIVCRAEYCKKCVMKAMGSMPEGRKCVGCIGKAIDESKRRKLGKGSRLLSRICSRSEMREIMKVERECKANQVRAEQVVVNGRELRENELDALLGCKVPPKGLKPGRYWYDKDSGLWGKEGENPSRIISSKLDVGGKLQSDASKGDTRIYLNGREITKLELGMLKLAKVQCLRDTHFWLYDDGSYEEEGQNIIKGNIWKSKASIRFICSLFSLPVPPRCTRDEPPSFSSRLFPEYLEKHRVRKLLLLGLEGSGKSTIFKQAKFIYANRFTPEEMKSIKLVIQTKMYEYLCALLEAREHFEEEALMKGESKPGEIQSDESKHCIYSVNQKITNFSNWLLELMATGDLNAFFPAASREYAPLIDQIWNDPAIRATYKRRDELPFLPDVAKYFLDRAVEISSNEYVPTENDILFTECVLPSNSLACIDFSFDDHSVISELYNKHLGTPQPLSTYQLIHFSSIEGFKWLDMFEGTSAIIFCISLSDYNQSKMLEHRDFFSRVARSSCFKNTPFLLLLTKYDMFEDKINKVPLSVCEWFSDFQPLKIHGKSVSLAHYAFYYIAVKFKDLYTSITGRKLYVRQVIGHERRSVDESLRYIREIMDWEEEKDEEGFFYGESDEDTVSGVERSL